MSISPLTLTYPSTQPTTKQAADVKPIVNLMPSPAVDKFEPAYFPLTGQPGALKPPTLPGAYEPPGFSPQEQALDALFRELMGKPISAGDTLLNFNTLNQLNAINQLHQHFDVLSAARDGVVKDYVTREDLEAALQKPDLPLKLEDACRLFLSCPYFHPKNRDAVANIAARAAEIYPPPKQPSFEQEWANSLGYVCLYFETARRNGQHFQGDVVHRADLQTIADGPQFANHFREACRFVLNQPAASHINEISIADLRSAYESAAARVAELGLK